MSFFTMDWSELSLQVTITFAHFLWQACAVAVALAIVEQLSSIVRRGKPPSDLSTSANLRYTFACLAFFALPICVAATFVWVHQSRGPIFLAASDPIESASFPIASMNEPIPPRANTEVSVLPSLEMPSNTELPVKEPIESPNLAMSAPSFTQRIQAYAPYLLFTYIIGVAFMFARFCLSIASSSRLRRTLQPIADSNILTMIAEQASRLGLKRVPIVALCQRVSVPVVVGMVKPMVLLPPTLLCGLDPNQLAAILSHELAHIRRWDLIVNLLQRIVEAILFFHPVTWWISRRVSIERENCCDDVAAACTGRLSYASALLQMAELCIGSDRRRSAALATLSADGGNTTDFGYRIRRLIGAEETTRIGLTRRSFAIGLALVSLLTVSLVAWGQNQKSTGKESEEADKRNAASHSSIGVQPKKMISGNISNELQGVSINARFEIAQTSDGSSNRTGYKLVHTASATTDAEGSYSMDVPDEIANIDGVLVSLRIEHPGYLTRYQERVIINNMQDVGSPISLRESRILKARILLPNGSPAVAATVVTDSKYRPYSWKFPDVNHDYPASAFAMTDSNGNFELATDPSGATLVARLVGQAPLIVDDLYGGSLLNIPISDDPQEFRLPRSIRAGGVVQTHDGQPIGGAIVVINRSFKWDEFHMPLSFATSVATDERGNFELPPLPADIFKFSVLAKLKDQKQVAEFNKITAENFPFPMRAAFLGHWNGFPRPKSTPQVDLLNVVIPEKEVDLEKLAGGVDIPLTPQIELKSVETIQVAAKWIDQSGGDREDRVDATIHGTFQGVPWHGVSRKADSNGIITLHAPKGVEDLVIDTGHAFHRRATNEPLQIGDSIHLGKLDQPLSGLEIIRPKFGKLKVKLKLSSKMFDDANFNREPINFIAQYVRDGFTRNIPSHRKLHLAGAKQTGVMDFEALALPDEEFVLRVTQGRNQTKLFEEQHTVKAGEMLERTIDLTNEEAPAPPIVHPNNNAQGAPSNAGLQIRTARYAIEDRDDGNSRSDSLKSISWTAGDGKTKNVQIDMQQHPLVAEGDILGVEACAPLMLQLTQAAQQRLASATVKPTTQGTPTPLLAILLRGELIGVAEIHTPIKAEQRIHIQLGNSSNASDRLREYVTPALVNYHCQSVPETAPDNSFSVSSKLFAVESSPAGQRKLVVHYQIRQANAKTTRVQFTDGSNTEFKTLHPGESIDVQVVNAPLPGRYKVIPKIVADGDHFNIESTVTRSLNGVATQDEFLAPVVNVRFLTETSSLDKQKSQGDSSDVWMIVGTQRLAAAFAQNLRIQKKFLAR